MKKLKWTVIAVSLFVALLIIKMPAEHLLHRLPLPQNVQLGAVEGSVWSGRIRTLLVDETLLENVQWDLNVWAFLTGGVEGELSIGHRTSFIRGKGHLRLTPTRVSVQDLTLELPAAAISRYLPLPIPMQIGGDVRVDIKRFRQAEPICNELEGRVDWFQGSVNNMLMKQPLRLEQTTAILSCVDGGVLADISDNEGMLGLKAKVALPDPAHYKIEAVVDPAADAPRSIRDGLEMIATDKGIGYELSFDGQL